MFIKNNLNLDWVGWILDRSRSPSAKGAPHSSPAQPIGLDIKPQNIQSPEGTIQNPRLCFGLLNLIGADHRLASKLLIYMAESKKAGQFVVQY